MEVGFIGLGSMGSAMARNLLKAGHRVHVWNRSPGPAEALAEFGAQVAASPLDAFHGEAVLSMLANDAAVREVLIDSGALAQAPAGIIHGNMATVSVQLAEELDALHASQGLGYVAAPVFGRPDAAAEGALNIVAAGPGALIDRLQPLFNVLGTKTWRVGEQAPKANVVKIAGNFMIACAIEAMGEAAAMAAAYQVPAHELIGILSNTLFASVVYKGYGERIVKDAFEPAGFKLRLGLKDVQLALDASHAQYVPVPFASVLRDRLLDALAHGDGDLDWAALSRVSYRAAGFEVGNTAIGEIPKRRV